MSGKLASVLREKLARRNALAAPGCYDALSARVIEAAGFEAVEVSGFGLAGSLLGKPDVGLVDMRDILDTTWKIARAVRIPVLADIDTGGASAMHAADITARLIEMAVAGVIIEDHAPLGRGGHRDGGQAIAAAEMAGKVRAMADARVEAGGDIVINARTGAYGTGGLDEAIRRANLYLEAGADMVFLDGIATRAEIARAAREIHGFVAVSLMDGTTGVEAEPVPIPELARLGVALAGIPAASILAAHRALTEFFAALRASPTGLPEDGKERLTGLAAYNAFVGLPEHRAMEQRYVERAAAAAV